MILILDNLSATIVGMVVIAAMFALQVRVQESTVERTVLYQAKKQTLAFGEMLERDLDNAGFGVLPGEEGITGFDDDSSMGLTFTRELVFRSADPAGNPISIRYRAAVADTAEINGVPRPLLSVTREENDGAGWQMSGGTPANIADFDVDILNENNVNVARANARKVRVRFMTGLVKNRYGGPGSARQKRYLDELVWGMTIEPAGLRNQVFQG